MNGMMRRYEQLKELSLCDWWLLLTSMILLPMIAFSLKILGFKQTRNLMSHFIFINTIFDKPDNTVMHKAHIIARVVSVAARHGPYHANCLKQSLLLWWELARRGIPSEIKFGVQKDPEEKFGAHAWLECRGVVLTNSLENQQRFSVFV